MILNTFKYGTKLVWAFGFQPIHYESQNIAQRWPENPKIAQKLPKYFS